MNLFIQVVLVFSFISFLLVSMIDQGNELIELRATLPVLEKELQGLRQEVVLLKYEITRQENPVHLMEWLKKPECGHLNFPYEDEVIVIE